jgi:hypothetical protein
MIVLQNYFRDQIEQHCFKDERRRATSIQSTSHSDSIIAISQRSEEFCNTIGIAADIDWPPAGAGSDESDPSRHGLRFSALFKKQLARSQI